MLLLADALGFDGSFPRAVARLVATAGEAHRKDWKHGAPPNLSCALLVVTKLDLLSRGLRQLHLEDNAPWCRRCRRAVALLKLRKCLALLASYH